MSSPRRSRTRSRSRERTFRRDARTRYKDERRPSPRYERAGLDDKHRHRGRSRSRSHSPSRLDHRSRSRSPVRVRRRSPSRSKSRSKSRSRSRSRSRSLQRRLRGRHHSRSRSRSRSRSKEKRGKEKDQRRKGRSRSRSASSVSSNVSERRSKRRKKDKHAKRSSRSRERKERKKEKKEKKKKHGAGPTPHWGKYGIINEADQFMKTAEFQTWLVEERKVNPETISKEQNRKEFAKFIEDYNTATLPHEKYYNIAAYEARMSAMRQGEFVPPPEDSYDPMADMKAHSTRHKKAPIERESYLSKEQLMELRKVQHERIEAGRRKLLGLEVTSSYGVRMDGTSFDD